jgi:hypothetical protein
MKRIFVELQDDPKLLIDHLEANADKVVDDYHYIREMTMAERAELEARYIELSKKVDAMAEEFKSIKEEFDGKINPIKKQVALDIKTLRQGRIHESGTVYIMDNYEEKVSEVYNEKGYLVEERPLRAKQKTIFSEVREKSEY